MVNHVNTVLVSNSTNASLLDGEQIKPVEDYEQIASLRGRYIVYDPDSNEYKISNKTRRFKIGMADGTYAETYDRKDHKQKFTPNIRWSNIIQLNAITSINLQKYQKNKDEQVTIDFAGIKAEIAKRQTPVSITLRIQYKDMPTRYRQWSESYNYLADGSESDEDLAEKFSDLIVRETKRQRVNTKTDGTKLVLTAMKYEDPKIYDQGYDNSVRFNVVMYYQLPQADGITFNNKYYFPEPESGHRITKVEGERYAADAIIVRTREIESWDYMGVLHRCCWFDPTPAVMTNIENKYDALTIEFENEYHAADDIRRHTKETVELYAITGSNPLENDIVKNINDALTDAGKKFVTENVDRVAPAEENAAQAGA